LKSQIRRSAVSVASNIAEGAGRNSNKQFIYFLQIAQGSLAELETQLLLIENLTSLKVKSKLKHEILILQKLLNTYLNKFS